jgi:hypothetical protein
MATGTGSRVPVHLARHATAFVPLITFLIIHGVVLGAAVLVYQP